MSQVRSTYQVKGLENALKELRKVEPETVKTLRKDARKIAAPAVKAAKKEFEWQASVSRSYQADVKGGRRRNKPAVTPLSGMADGVLIKGRSVTKWNPSKVKSGIGFRMGGPAKSRRSYKAFRMFTIIQNNPAGAIYDMAGKLKGATNPSKTFEESLEATENNHYSTTGKGPSRYMYPAVESHIPHMQEQMKALIRELEKKINRRILVGGN